MNPTFLLLTWRHGNRVSISSSQAVTWLGHGDFGPDAPRLAPVSPAANLLQSPIFGSFDSIGGNPEGDFQEKWKGWETGSMAHAFHSSSFPPLGAGIAKSVQRGNYRRDPRFIGTNPALFPRCAGFSSFRASTSLAHPEEVHVWAADVDLLYLLKPEYIGGRPLRWRHVCPAQWARNKIHTIQSSPKKRGIQRRTSDAVRSIDTKVSPIPWFY